MAKAPDSRALAGQMLAADRPAFKPSNRSRMLAACASAAVVCAPLTGQFEGYVPKAKSDPVGIKTGCYGERVDQSDLDPSRIYSRGECMERLRKRLAGEYAPKIAACLPQLVEPNRHNEFVALLDTSFNGGPPAVCRSPMAIAIKADNWAAACDAIRTYRVGSVTARPVKGARAVRLIASGPNKGKYFNTFGGLVDRRAFFASFCMKPEAAQ
jgi:GH24 family phage-related lysozyme (muramidase)